MKNSVTILTNTIRKIKNQDAYKVIINAIKADGSRHDKMFIVNGSRSKAQGRRAMQLRNMTQKADVVIF